MLFHDTYHFFNDLWNDYKLGINTRGNIDLDQLDIGSEVVLHARKYQPTRYSLLKRIAKEHPLPPSQWRLLDVGMGKGRVLCWALNRGAQSVCGVDISPKVYDIAQINLKKQSQNNDHFQLILGDITKTSLPLDINHIFLFNPFDGALVKKFVEKLLKTPFKGPKIFITYVNPLRGHFFEMRTEIKLCCTLSHQNPNLITHIYEFLPKTIGEI